jgi:hypothetical protein
MARFYFHLRSGDQIVPDLEGTELPDFPSAQHEALLNARELLAEAINSGKSEIAEAFVIADEAARALAVVPVVAALPKQRN